MHIFDADKTPSRSWYRFASWQGIKSGVWALPHRLKASLDGPYVDVRAYRHKDTKKRVFSACTHSCLWYNFLETLPRNHQDAVMNHLATVGPLSIALDASSFSLYQGGVFDKCDYDKNIEINHGVQLVGYGSSPDEGDYWLVRNSWYLKHLHSPQPGLQLHYQTLQFKTNASFQEIT